MSERLKHIKETLMTAIESQIYNLSEVDTEELGDVIDMVKDLEEATYYCAVVKAMEESEKNGGYQSKEMMYYTPMMYRDGQNYYTENSGNTDGRDMPRRYYNGSSGGNSGGQSNGGNNSSSSGGSRGGSNAQYSEREFPNAFMDEREGRSPRSRRMYMEAKESKQDKTIQMRELEKYMQELSQDIVEMIEDASSEERQYLSKKISALATKISQTNG